MAVQATLYTTGSIGEIHYSIIQGDSGYLNGTTPETYNADNWTSYAQSMTDPNDTGVYQLEWPTIGVGYYVVTSYQQVGDYPLYTDMIDGAAVYYWDGTKLLTVEDANIPAVVRSVSVDVANPVAQDSNLTLTAGDDYTTAQQLVWSSEQWPDLTGAMSVAFSAESLTTGNRDISGASVEVVTAGSSGTQSVRVPLTKTQTAALTIGASIYRYAVRATLASGERVTLARGFATVLDPVNS